MLDDADDAAGIGWLDAVLGVMVDFGACLEKYSWKM